MEGGIYSLKVTYDNKAQVITLEGIDALDKDGSTSIQVADVAQLHFLLTTIQELIKKNIKSKIVKVADAKSCIKNYLTLEGEPELSSKEEPVSELLFPKSRSGSASSEPFIFPTKRAKSPIRSFIFREEKSPSEVSSRRKESFELPVRSKSPFSRKGNSREEKSFELPGRPKSSLPLGRLKSSSPTRVLLHKVEDTPLSTKRPTNLAEEECVIIPYKSRLESLPLILKGKINPILEGDFKETAIFRVLANDLIIEGDGIIFPFIFTKLLRVWQVENKKKILVYEGSIDMGNPFGLPDGRIISSVRDEGKHKLAIFNPETGRTELNSKEIKFPADIFRLLHDCQIMAIVGGNVGIWYLDTLELKLFLSNANQASDFDILPNGYIIVACHYEVEIWDPISNKLIQYLRHSHVMSSSDRMGHETHLKAISDDKFITSTYPGIQTWNRSSGEKRLLEGASGTWGFLALNDKLIAARSSSNFIPGTFNFADIKIKIWDIETGKIVSTFEREFDRFKTKLVLCSSEQIGIGSKNMVVLWNFKTNTSKVIYEGEYVIDFGVFQDNRIYVVIGKEIYYPRRSTPDIKFLGVKLIS